MMMPFRLKYEAEEILIEHMDALIACRQSYYYVGPEIFEALEKLLGFTGVRILGYHNAWGFVKLRLKYSFN